MSERWQIRRGTTAENDGFTGGEGEITMDTEKKQLRVHDGTTQGGAGIIDPIVAFQVPTAGNNYTWYRKYRSGWVEQGQNYVALNSNGQTFTMPITMADNKYNIQCTGVAGTNKTSTTVGVYVSTYDTRTTTTFSCYSGDDASFNACYFAWRVCGMAA